MKIPKKYLNRQAEITEAFLEAMNTHMDDFMAGRTDEMMHLKDLARILCLHPVHISHVIKLFTGYHPCYFYEKRILEEAKRMLENTAFTISEVAMQLTYDTSNFTKFFKEKEGITPSAYRRQLS